MYKRRFSGSGPAKTINCSCGSIAKMGKRRNFPYGKKSNAVTLVFYKCDSCKKEVPMPKMQEFKR